MGDKNGNIIEEKYFKSDGSIDGNSTYKYEYDKMGNWIKQSSFNDGKSKNIIERVIELPINKINNKF